MIDVFVNLLPAKLRPFAKAIYPALAALVALVVQIIATGAFSGPELTTAIAGFISALITYFVPNKGSHVEG